MDEDEAMTRRAAPGYPGLGGGPCAETALPPMIWPTNGPKVPEKWPLVGWLALPSVESCPTILSMAGH
jgi:hypothetical protein